jgi:uncharacterized membrane-anchored protein
MAQITVPAGFRFAGAEGARSILKGMRNPVPENLAGVLMPDNGKWLILFEQSTAGHVTDEDKTSLDTESILKGLDKWTISQNHSRKQAGLPLIASLAWESKPAYQEREHLLDWAVRAEESGGAGKPVINHTFKLLGKAGAVDAVVVQSAGETVDAGVLKAILSNVRFKPGFRYEDFKAGDKVAVGGLAQAIINSGTESQRETAPGLVSRYGTVVAFCATLIGAAMVGILMARRSRRSVPSLKPLVQPSQAVGPASAADALPVKAAPPLLNGAAARNGQAHTNGHTNGHGRPATLKMGPANGFSRARLAPKSQGPRKKRMFNYAKFYTDMVMQGSSGAGADNFNNEFEMSRYAHAMFGMGYNPNQPPQGDQPKKTGPTADEGRDAARLVNSHADLLATQKSLIGEQSRLIEEQARLIEEKSRMIAEKNQLLKRQSEMMDNNLL